MPSKASVPTGHLCVSLRATGCPTPLPSYSKTLKLNNCLNCPFVPTAAILIPYPHSILPVPKSGQVNKLGPLGRAMGAARLVCPRSREPRENPLFRRELQPDSPRPPHRRPRGRRGGGVPT